MKAHKFCVATLREVLSRSYDETVLLSAVRLLIESPPGDDFPSKPEDYASYLIKRALSGEQKAMG